jgi:hypothetical protein
MLAIWTMNLGVGSMKRLFLIVGVLLVAAAVPNRSMAADAFGAWINGLPSAWVEGPSCNPYVDYNCDPSKAALAAAKAAARARGICDPYVDYGCLDTYLGDNFFTRFYRYYELEWGKAVPPADPNAPASQRPVTDPNWLGASNLPYPSPPMPFTAWPYGGTQSLGASLPNAVDSPLMVALGNTTLGKWMNDAHIQVYGWVDPAGNLSTNTVKPAGNLPISYDYTPNTIQLDQAVLYIERVPDEVQNDHFDWGFRLSGLYGVDYRYTTSFGIGSYQLIDHNFVNGWDVPMMYVDLYFPVLYGMNVRVGRFISIPDIEAQLAPNNYTYVHSLTYTWDNYTNEGIEFTLAMTHNWILQFGPSIGTEATLWHYKVTQPNQYVNSGNNAAGFGPGVDPLYPGANMLVDPGAQPSITAGIKWTSDDGRDDFNFVLDAWNGGQWGWNNLQWIGFTYYHKLNDYWHIAVEVWDIHENGVPNLNNPASQALIANGGTPFSPQYFPFNGANAAVCGGPGAFVGGAPVQTAGTPLTCNPNEQSFLVYVNYSPNKLNNFSLRTEYFNDPYGQRTGIPTAYMDVAGGWQHWLSPQIELRPEIGYYRSLQNAAFNGNSAAGIVPSRDWAVIAASDIIIHF